MTAKEMFEKEGFIYARDNIFIIYDKKHEDNKDITVMKIIFHKGLKNVFVSGIRRSVMLDIECMKAINQQLKELGWLNE